MGRHEAILQCDFVDAPVMPFCRPRKIPSNGRMHRGVWRKQHPRAESALQTYPYVAQAQHFIGTHVGVHSTIRDGGKHKANCRQPNGTRYPCSNREVREFQHVCNNECARLLFIPMLLTIWQGL